MVEITDTNLSPEGQEYGEDDFQREVEESKQKALRDVEEMKQTDPALAEAIHSRVHAKRDEIDWELGFTNNFHLRLPGAADRELTQRRKAMAENKSPEYLERLRLKERLYEDIDRQIEILGIGDVVREMVNTWKRQDKSDDVFRKHHEALKNLYIALRKLGYKHYPDLVA